MLAVSCLIVLPWKFRSFCCRDCQVIWWWQEWFKRTAARNLTSKTDELPIFYHIAREYTHSNIVRKRADIYIVLLAISFSTLWLRKTKRIRINISFTLNRLSQSVYFPGWIVANLERIELMTIPISQESRKSPSENYTKGRTGENHFKFILLLLLLYLKRF